jgi:hypothetical protein
MIEKAPLTTQQVLALCEETRAVVELSRRGIDELWKIDGSNYVVQVPMQLLAQGFERFLKLTYALAFLKREGYLPDARTFRKTYGHDLAKLCEDLLELVSIEADYTARPVVQEDLHFMRTDIDLRRYLRLLTTFGVWSRYYRFEAFLGRPNLDSKDDPDQEWREIESDALRATDGWAELLASPTGSGEVHRRVAEHVGHTLTRFARAISRMWTLGALHPEARRHTATIGGFLYLNDTELGTRPDPDGRR